MKLEDQVCSLVLAKRLKELGVKRESVFAHYGFHGIEKSEWHILPTNSDWNSAEDKGVYDEKIAAFTVAELGEMFPYVSCLCYTCFLGVNWLCIYATELTETEGVLKVADETYGVTEADARALMLANLIKKGIVKP